MCHFFPVTKRGQNKVSQIQNRINTTTYGVSLYPRYLKALKKGKGKEMNKTFWNFENTAGAGKGSQDLATNLG